MRHYVPVAAKCVFVTRVGVGRAQKSRPQSLE